MSFAVRIDAQSVVTAFVGLTDPAINLRHQCVELKQILTDLNRDTGDTQDKKPAIFTAAMRIHQELTK